MARVLLADDSPHAQRMGERILREGGHEVTAVMDGERALMRLSEVDPDVVLVDAFLPYRDGYELCEFIKTHQRFRHVRVVLTAGLLEPLDEHRARHVSCDAILKKPFEASVVIETLRPLFDRARRDREAFGLLPSVKLAPSLESLLGDDDDHLDDEPTLDTVIPASPPAPWMAPVTMMPVPTAGGAAAAPALSQPEPLIASGLAPVMPPPQLIPLRDVVVAEADPEMVRAAVTLALDAAMPALIDELTRRVISALNPKEDRKVNHG
jgi:CheY-like chemotaxis protein